MQSSDAKQVVKDGVLFFMLCTNAFDGDRVALSAISMPTCREHLAQKVLRTSFHPKNLLNAPDEVINTSTV